MTPAPTAGATLDELVTLPETEKTGNALVDDYLNTGKTFGDTGISALGALHIVFDGEYAPADYELLDIEKQAAKANEVLKLVIENEKLGNSALVCAMPDENGNVDRRSLILSADQLVKLAQDQETEHIVFENGDAMAEMDMADLLGGDLPKLMKLIAGGEEEITPEVLVRDWSEIEEAELTAEELGKINVETRIVPVAQEDGSIAYEVSVHLRWDESDLDVSSMVPSFTVCINVDALVNEENFETFAQHYGLVYVDAETGESVQLESELLLIPDELPDHQDDTAQCFTVKMGEDEGAPEVGYHPVINLYPYRHYVLAANYAGPGRYFVQG